MSVTGLNTVGIPVILLHDAEGARITIELKNGCTYTGLLEEAQDNMNCTLKDVIRTNLDNTTQQLEMVYIRGSQVRFFVMPEILKHAPFFNRIKIWRKYKGKYIMGSGSSYMREKLASHTGSGGAGAGVMSNFAGGGGSGGGGVRYEGSGTGRGLNQLDSKSAFKDGLPPGVPASTDPRILQAMAKAMAFHEEAKQKRGQQGVQGQLPFPQHPSSSSTMYGRGAPGGAYMYGGGGPGPGPMPPHVMGGPRMPPGMMHPQSQGQGMPMPMGRGMPMNMPIGMMPRGMTGPPPSVEMGIGAGLPMPRGPPPGQGPPGRGPPPPL